MSDEEFDEEQQILTLRTLPWRDDEATDLIRRIDATLKEVRVYGQEPSTRAPCKNCANFVKEGYELRDNDDDEEEAE